MASVAELVAGLNAGELQGGANQAEVVVFPAYVHLAQVRSSLRSDFAVGAQDAWAEPKGAFTGAVSADMLVDLGIAWTIVGHSERRTIFAESDDLVARKAARALEVGLSVVACLGESLQEFESSRTEEVVSRQLAAYARRLRAQDWSRFVIAYEPVWAIGTGKTATPERAQEVHQILRRWLETHVSPEVASQARILYGGSVTPATAEGLASKPDVDGFLVGGASLKPADFIAIINAGIRAKSQKTKL
jgi:triosephosphate isomerase